MSRVICYLAFLIKTINVVTLIMILVKIISPFYKKQQISKTRIKSAFADIPIFHKIHKNER